MKALTLFVFREFLFDMLINSKDHTFTIRLTRQQMKDLYKELSKLAKEDKI